VEVTPDVVISLAQQVDRSGAKSKQFRLDNRDVRVVLAYSALLSSDGFEDLTEDSQVGVIDHCPYEAFNSRRKPEISFSVLLMNFSYWDFS